MNEFCKKSNQRGELLIVSSSLLKLLKIDDFDQKIYTIDDFLDQEDARQVKRHMASNDTSLYEITLRHNGVSIPVLVQGNSDIFHNTTARIAILIDLREVKRLQEEAWQKDLLLFQQAKMAQMGEMVNMIAHQWRQPLNAISTASIKAVMKRQLGELSDEEFYRTHEFIQKECQEMSKIINLFLQYAHAQQKVEAFRLEDVLDTVCSLIKAQFKSHNIKIEIQNDNPFVIRGSKDMLEQVILNLLINARDAYDEQKVETEKKITIKTTDKKRIEVIDFAGGIDEKYIEKLFMPYFTTKEQGKGTGVGLYMSRRIMRDHFKGNLRYEKIENGSRFILDFESN